MLENWLSEDEGIRCEGAIRAIQDQPWADKLLAEVRNGGGVTGSNKSRLFELRFAHALHVAGVKPDYEIRGEADSSIDFGFTRSGIEFKVELMRPAESKAARESSFSNEETGEFGAMFISDTGSGSSDPRSEEGEILKTIQRICQKFEHKGRPHKFPPPTSAIHVLLVDARELLSGCIDKFDCTEIANRDIRLPDFYRHYWVQNQKAGPISGVFNPENSFKGAETARARLHVLAFLLGVSFLDDVLLIPNPNLLDLGRWTEIRSAWPCASMDLRL